MAFQEDEEAQRLRFQLALEESDVPLEHILLARALNETLDGLGVDGSRASYSGDDVGKD
ncbi:hypothetical protein ACIPY2_04115 [Paenarthrobacter sp. NPDC089675]|uniref:hypothetical protein n=1 Tax=Paenarthrobacter sp. NPDC089675 TaxID=3364376 RepID=UPI00382FC9B6